MIINCTAVNSQVVSTYLQFDHTVLNLNKMYDLVTIF